MFLQLILILIGPLVGISVRQNPESTIDGDLLYESSNKSVQVVLEVTRYALMIGMY